jgi:hypothetical protein
VLKEKYERIKILGRRCTELEPEGLKVKNQLTTLRMKIFKETNVTLNKNKRQGKKNLSRNLTN